MIDDYKYRYLSKPLYMDVYILRIVLIFGIFLGFMGYLDLWVEKKSNSIYHLNQERRM